MFKVNKITGILQGEILVGSSRHHRWTSLQEQQDRHVSSEEKLRQRTVKRNFSNWWGWWWKWERSCVMNSTRSNNETSASSELEKKFQISSLRKSRDDGSGRARRVWCEMKCYQITSLRYEVSHVRFSWQLKSSFSLWLHLSRIIMMTILKSSE